MLVEIIKFILKVLYYIVDIAVVGYAIYYIVTGIFAFFNKRNVIRKYRPRYKIAVLIAARNEGKVIGNLLDSLNKQNYPKDLYDVFVIPNNCTDNTEEVAKQKGAKVINCTVPVKCKGDVLKFTFEYMNNNYPEYEAYAIFDADNIVHPDYVRRMNDALCAGYKVAQGYRDSKNPQDSWISSCYSLFYWVQNYFFNQARMNMGWSSSINGTGFIISKEVIDKHGFNTFTMTEDIEFAAQCALNDEKIAFVKDAITYDEQPLSFTQSWKQRKRWSVGTLQCLGYYSPRLLITGIKKKIPQAIDMSLFYLAPVIQLFACILILMLMVYSHIGIEVSDVVKLMYDNKIFSVILGYVAGVVIALYIVMKERKKIGKTIKGILTLSFFMLTWVPINALCLVKKDHKWEPIEHNRTVDIDSIVDSSNN